MVYSTREELFLRALDRTIKNLGPDVKPWVNSHLVLTKSVEDTIKSLQQGLESLAYSRTDGATLGRKGTSSSSGSSGSRNNGRSVLEAFASLANPHIKATMSLVAKAGLTKNELERMTSFFNKRLAQAQHALETINKTLEGLPRAQALNQPILSIYLLIVELWILAGLHVEKAEASQPNISLTQSLKSICESAERFEEELPEEMEKLLKAANEERKRRETRVEQEKTIRSALEITGPNNQCIADTYLARHQLVRERWDKQTCHWIRTEPKFSAWLDSEESDILWIHGPSGMGKSVLCGYIIDEILRKPRQIATSQGETKTVEAVPEGNILWFYCTGDNHLQASRSEIIKSFVRQIYLAHWPRSDLDNEPDPEIRSKSNGIVQFIAKNFRSDDFTRLNEPDVMQKFESLFMRLADSPIYVLLDGLDEFSQEHDMDVEGVWEYLWRFHDKVFESLDVATFQHIEESALPKSPSSKITIKVLLLSRPLHRLMLKCENPTPTDIPISDLDLPLRQVREDVQKYLRARVREKLSQLADAPSLQQDDTALSAKVNDIVHKMLPDTAGSSLFLWAFYMSQEINECHSTASIEDICRHDHFPTVTAKSSSFSAASAVTLRAYYTHVLHRMYSRLPAHPEEQKAVSRALLWVTYAANTLSVRQLSQVPSQAPLGSSKDLAAAIRRYLGSFVQAPHLTQGDPGVDRPDNMLRLTHYSVAEYMRTITPEEQWAKFSADSDIAITTPSNSHSKLLEDCLLYLEDEAFNKPFVNIRGSATLRKHLDNEGRHAFFAYAATNWTYHLTRVTDRADAKRCSDAMERFFKSPSLKGWMEGSITLYGGCEWITTLVAMVEKWFRDRGFNPESQCKPFQDWVSDVTNIKFEDYEQTLLYNNNEVHFLDVGRLLPRTSRHFPPTEGDVLHPLEEDAASTKEESWHLDATGSIPHLALARKLPEGEDGENMIGYLSLDRNDEANRGLLSIDLKCNHPRLVWEQIIFGPHGGTGERQVGNDGSGNSKAKNRRLRLSSVIPLTRSKAHSQFTALSAALSEDGNKLAAVYREEVDSKTIKLRVILWTFKHTKRADQIGGEFLAGWKAGLDSRMTDIEKSLVTLYHATETRVKFRTGAREIDPGAAADAKKIVEDLCNGPAFKRVKEVAQTLGARPALPSMEPLEEGLPWAEAEELEQCCYGRGEMKVSAASPCADSRYLVAFWDSQTLITPSGVFDLEQKKTLKNRNFHGLENGDFGKSFVLAPMGRFLLSTAEKKLTVVDLDPFREPWIRSRRYWDASQLGEGVRIVSVLDCSPSGCMASLHVEKTFVKDGKRACTLGVVVVDLSSLAFSLVFCQTVTGRRLGIIRTVFCPRDNHLAIASQEAEEGSLGPSRYSIWVANITAGTCSLLETRTLMPHAMVYLQCNDTGCLSPSDENTEKTKQPEAQALSESMSNLLRLRLQDIEYVRKPMRKPWAFDPSHFKSNGIINDGARGMRLDNRSLREGIDKMLSRLLDASSLFGNIRSPYHRDPPEACKKTVIGVVLEDRTVHLLEFHNTLPSSKHEMTLEDLPLVTAICRPSWTREEISAAWMQFSLKSSNVDEPEPVGATTVNMSLLWKHWEFDLDDKVEKPLTEPVKFKLEPFDSAPGDVLYRGLSLSRSLQILAFWIGRNCKFLQLVSDAGGRTSAKVMRTLHKPGIEAVHSQLCCLDVMFNRDDSYAAVLWCPPPSPGADAPAVPSLRGTFLTLSRLNIDAGIVDVRGALAVDTDARGYRFHPTEPLIAITCADQYLICKYGIDGFSVLRTIDAAEARATLFIPGKPNGPSSPPSTDETVKEAPVTGLPPIYFSTCGTFLFSRDWDAFAWVKDVKSHDVVLSGRAVLDSFMEEAAEARKADESRRVVRAPNADEARRTEATHTTDTSGSTEPEPAPGQWLLTEMHPPVMYEGTLYAVGRHRLKIFRIRTYIVLGWAADADNLWWPVIEDPKKEAPQPKDPTWYRRVLCAIPQSMSTWRAVLYWPPGRDACFTLVLFPTPESRSSAAESMPTVIYTTRSWLDVYSPNNGFGIEWLRGHASGCPYQLKA